MKTLTTNAKEYKLYWVRGKVEESGKNLETIVSGSGGGTVNAGTHMRVLHLYLLAQRQ